MTDLSELIEKVRAATGPDRGLDGMIAAAVAGWTKTPLDWTDQHGRKRNAPPTFTGSIDAIAALVEAKLPGWVWGVDSSGASWLIDTNNNGTVYSSSTGAASTDRTTLYVRQKRPPALTLCLAFLLAMQATGAK